MPSVVNKHFIPNYQTINQSSIYIEKAILNRNREAIGTSQLSAGCKKTRFLVLVSNLIFCQTRVDKFPNKLIQ